MSVRIVRTRNGEDVIADLYEVTTKEDTEKAIAFQLIHPYNVFIDEGVTVETPGEIQKISSPEISFQPWAPLSKERRIMLKLEEVVTAYETYDEVIKKYTEIVEAASGRGNDSGTTGDRGSTFGTDGGSDDPAADQSDPVEAEG